MMTMMVMMMMMMVMLASQSGTMMRMSSRRMMKMKMKTVRRRLHPWALPLPWISKRTAVPAIGQGTTQETKVPSMPGIRSKSRSTAKKRHPQGTTDPSPKTKQVPVPVPVPEGGWATEALCSETTIAEQFQGTGRQALAQDMPVRLRSGGSHHHLLLLLLAAVVVAVARG